MRFLASVMLNGLCAAALAGCGGGGSTQSATFGGTAVTPAPAPAPVPTPTPTPTPPPVNVVQVASLETLVAALDQARSGDEIRVAGGNYGTLNLRTRAFPSNVTVVAEAGQVAQFDSVNLTDVSNLTLRKLSIGRALAPTEANWARFASVSNSTNIAFDQVHFRGSMDGNPQNDGRGLFVQNSRDIAVTNSTFEQLYIGFEIGGTQNIVASGNTFHDIRNDGMNFSAVSNVTLHGNFFTNFFPLVNPDGSGDHPDAIQFFTAGSKLASRDIVITSNVVLQGSGGGSQGIFLTDQIGGLPYRNVRIENNLIYVRGWNGIMVGGGENVTINGNSTISPTDDALFLRIRLQNVEGISMINNVVDEFTFEISPPSHVNSVELRYDPAAQARIPNLNAGKNARVADLLYPGSGYKPTS